jgi:class 3 adenylate cyclase
MSNKSFLSEERDNFIKRMTVASLYFATPLVLSFTVVDYFFLREKQLSFLLVRLIVVPVSAIVYFLYKIKLVRDKYYQFPALLLLLFLGCYHAYLVTQSGYEKSGYYAGINLAAITAFSLLPWRPSFLVAVAISTFGPYICVILSVGHKIDLSSLIPNIAFMASTCFLGITTFFINRQLRVREVDSRLRLEAQNDEQAKIIKVKTQEGVYLERLASQFSPQVINAIKSGELRLDKRERKDITCVFLDIENSTRRSNRIDHANYNNLIGDFFSNCVEIFLKHDVTVGTYLGDGILAFANAPGTDPAHQSKVVKACIEILADQQRRSDYYKEKWRTNFNIRIGIETGFSTVGFFPSKDRGTYTALGETVNLAARLCARSPSNSICVTKSFLKSLGSENLEVVEVRREASVSDFKGFEGEEFELFSIVPKMVSAKLDKHVCGLCSAPMVIESDLGECLYMSCPSCNYKDIIDKVEKNTVTTAA